MGVPDNYDSFLHHQAEQDRLLDSLPVCNCCNEPIQDEYCYEIDSGLVCEECLKDNYRKPTENYEKQKGC
jgi:formylmethanofuran dehydrogenase subunit E